MKVFIITAFAGLLLFSCSKTSSSGQKTITGKWELRQSTGGIAGTINYAPGNGRIYQFDNNKKFQLLYPASPIISGTYEVSASSHTGDWLLQLQFVNNNQVLTTKDSIHFEANKLIFLSTAPYVDMPTLSYERLLY